MDPPIAVGDLGDARAVAAGASQPIPSRARDRAAPTRHATPRWPLASPPPAMPPIVDQNNSSVFDAVFGSIHSFRMPTFFVVAGFFTALLVEKRGVAATCKDRVRRVLAPLLAGADAGDQAAATTSVAAKSCPL